MEFLSYFGTLALGMTFPFYPMLCNTLDAGTFTDSLTRIYRRWGIIYPRHVWW